MARWPRRRRWRLASLAPVGFLALGIAIVALTSELPSAQQFARYSGTGASVGALGVAVLVNAFGEEAGWRGHALPRLQDRVGAPARRPAVGRPVGALARAAVPGPCQLPGLRPLSPSRFRHRSHRRRARPDRDLQRHRRQHPRRRAGARLIQPRRGHQRDRRHHRRRRDRPRDLLGRQHHLTRARRTARTDTLDTDGLEFGALGMPGPPRAHGQRALYARSPAARRGWRVAWVVARNRPTR
jgi:hypothetical protein